MSYGAATKIKRISAKRLIDRTVRHYLESDDFNGLSLSEMFGAQIQNVEGVKEFLKPLIETQRITVRCDVVDLNPFIKRMPDLSPDSEVARLNEWQGGILISYPTQKELETKVRREDFVGRPFSLEMALGAAWLDFRTFDLGVLEQYRNDPRYFYQVSDTHGDISVYDEHYTGTKMKESDKVSLAHFGFAYDDSMNRAIAVFLIDLHRLSPEHQRIWEARLLHGKYKLHPIFWETQIQGIWVKESVVTDAILWEMHRINECCKIMKRPPLFHRDYWQEERPRNFCFLIRPTAKEFAEFCQTLDKMMSENISRKFFRGEIPEKKEKELKGGKIEVITKGTITLLEEWLLKNWKPKDPAAFQSCFSIFKEVRKLRNPQAHTLINNTFDQKHLAEQRTLLTKTYEVMKMLGFIFESHPRVKFQTKESNKPEGEIYIY
jgi:hypothetical protein